MVQIEIYGSVLSAGMNGIGICIDCLHGFIGINSEHEEFHYWFTVTSLCQLSCAWYERLNGYSLEH